MYSKFNFSHTFNLQSVNNNTPPPAPEHNRNVQKVSIDDDSDDFDGLFMIGDKNITSGKDQSKKQKKIKKQKKEKNKKHRKDKKDEKQKKKKKKEKKKRVDKQSSQQSDATPIKKQSVSDAQQQCIIQQNEMQKLQRKMQILTKYEKQLSAYRTPQQQNNILNKQFTLKQKLTDDTLALDIIKFGLPELYQYGLQDRQIPYYKRYRWLRTVIGMKKKKKKIMKLLRQLNIITNQQQTNWEKYENTSMERYFHFVGYDRIAGEMPEKYVVIEDQKQNYQYSQNNEMMKWAQRQVQLSQIKPTIEYNPRAESIRKMATKEQKLRTINKQYNTAINSNPNDISLWLKFFDIQDSVAELTLSQSDFQQTQLHKNALMERKLAILQKALQKNPLDSELGLKYITLLSEAKKDPRYIQQQTQKLLQAHPDSQKLWKFYLSLKLTNIINFKHSRLQKQLQQINKYLFEKRIKEVKSGKQVWKIRKCGLVILEQVLKIHRLEGYYQLCTAICCALLQFNIFCGSKADFDRNERLQLFQKYWEDYNVYKVGQIIWKPSANAQYNYNTWEGYQSRNLQQVNLKKIEIIDEGEYIGVKFQSKVQRLEDGYRTRRWLPTHTLHNMQEISQNPDTFILYEDIEIYLHVFRNMQNWQLLCNIAMANLAMPPIYDLSIDEGKIEQNWITTWLSYSIGNKFSQQSPYGSHSLYLWTRFWHPQLIMQFLQLHQISPNQKQNVSQVWKFVYAINVVQSLFVKFKQLGEVKLFRQVCQYLMFLYGTIYYLHTFTTLIPNINPILSTYSKQACLTRIQNLLASDPQNMNLWVLYIEYERYANKSVQECIQCYLSCITTFQPQLQDHGINSVGLEIIYWISQFLYRWGSGIQRSIVYGLMKKVLSGNWSGRQQPITIASLSEDSNISQMQRLLMGTTLKQLLQNYTSTRTSQDNKKSQHICIIYYILLELGQSPSTITPHLLSINTKFSFNILIDYCLIDLNHLKSMAIFTDKLDIKFVTFFARLALVQANGCLVGFYQRFFQRNFDKVRKQFTLGKNGADYTHKDYVEQTYTNKLYCWLLMMRILEPQFRRLSSCSNNINKEHQNMLTYFLRVAQKHLISTHEPVCVEIVCKLMNNPQIAYRYLNNFPFCRQMYSIAALQVQNADKVYKLVLQKQLRFNARSK